MASAAILFSEFPVSEHSGLLRLCLWCYIPNFMKIGLPVQKLLTFLFPIEMHGKGGFCPLLGSKNFFKNFWPPKGTSLAQTGSFDVLCVKIGSAVWAVPWFMKPKKMKTRIGQLLQLSWNILPFLRCFCLSVHLRVHISMSVNVPLVWTS